MKIQILILTSILINQGLCYKVRDFEPSLFKFGSIEEGFRVIQTGSNRIGYVMAFADLNGDRYTDYVAVQSQNTTNLLFYFWNVKDEQFTLYKKNLSIDKPIFIEEIIVYDLNQDEKNQFIITYNTTGLLTTILYTVQCFECNDNAVELINSKIENQTTFPFLMDNQGNDKIVKLVTFIGQERSLYLYNFSQARYEKSSFQSVINNQIQSFPKVQKHFASSIDLNNDCFTDLMIVSISSISNNIKQYQLEFYIKDNNNKYSLEKKVSLNNNNQNEIQSIQMITFSDIDNSGSVDLIFFFKSAGIYKMKALINSIVPDEICVSSKAGIPFTDFDLLATPDLQLSSDYKLTIKSFPHFNDVNADGLPDITTLMDFNGFTKVVILINEGNLRFHKYDDSWKAYDLNNPIQVLFYDFGEDGKMDLLILSEENQIVNGVNTKSFTRTSIINNLQSDTLHLKILPLSISSIYYQSDKKIQNTFGVTIQWLFTDIDGHKHVKTSNQKFQFNYGVFQLPYAYSGLGRTNNYLQEFTVGYQRYGQKQDWSPIIPNSQLMVYKQTGDWKLQTLLKNDQRVNSVIYISLMILLLMGIIIIYLGYKESQQDKRDHYNFIQLIR